MVHDVAAVRFPSLVIQGNAIRYIPRFAVQWLGMATRLPARFSWRLGAGIHCMYHAGYDGLVRSRRDNGLPNLDECNLPMYMARVRARHNGNGR